MEISGRRNKMMHSLYKIAISVVMQNEDNIEAFIDKLDGDVDVDNSDDKGSITQNHFIDKVMHIFQKKHTKDHRKDVGEKEKKMKKEVEYLSIRKISNNIQVLSDRLQLVTNFVNQCNDIINWKQSEKTLTVLLLYTWACNYTYFFLLYPILYVMRYMCLKYLRKHPIVEKPSNAIKCGDEDDPWDEGLGPRLKNTHSEQINGIFGFLWDDEKDKLGDSKPMNTYKEVKDIVEDGMDGDYNAQVGELMELLEESIAEKELNNNETKIDVLDKGETVGKNEDERRVYQNFVFRTLLDFQITSSNVIKKIDGMKGSIRGSCEFEEEKKSTVLFYKLFMLSFIGCVLGKYIPWKAIFIITVWISVLMNHPSKDAFFAMLSDEEVSGNEKKQVHEEAKLNDPIEMQMVEADHDSMNSKLITNVVVDEPLFVREVEIFEIEKRDMFTMKAYEEFGFSSSLFTVSDSTRLQKRKPNMARSLSDVGAPTGWNFFNEERWKVDADFKDSDFVRSCNELISHRGDELWVYDTTEEFRRRRWTCLCIPSV